MPRILRVNLTSGEIAHSDEMPKMTLAGGRSLTSHLIAAEVPPDCHPLGPRNKLVFAPGLLSATSAPCAGRLSVGCKSPLTGGIKESNAGGTATLKLGRLGLSALVVEGQAKAGDWHLLHISREGARLLPASKYAGLNNYRLAEALRERFGRAVGIVSIGAAGERRLTAASIAVTDGEGRPCRHAARGGPGAVMGSKGLKAIVIDDRGGSLRNPPGAGQFKEARQMVVDGLRRNPSTSVGLPNMGTALLVSLMNEVGALPTRNFRFGRFERVESISGEALFTNLLSRPGAKYGHACSPSCIIRCSNVYTGPEGEYLTSGLEYETLWSLGINCEIDDLDAVARMDHLCDDLGLDTIETGAAIAACMEAGLLSFGDADGSLRLLTEVEQGTVLGRVLGCGVATTARVLGVSRVPAVKGQSLSGYDPRAAKGIGVTFATSPMGADHTAGYSIVANVLNIGGFVDPLRPEGQVELSTSLQELQSALDSTGLCMFTALAMLDDPAIETGLLGMINAVAATSLDKTSLIAAGREILETERAFNRVAGLSAVHDTLPEFFREEPLPPHGTVYDVL
ncbi:MAG: aldehyde ferredoxin oxidoreductase family protein [Chloroflexota bacterium]